MGARCFSDVGGQIGFVSFRALIEHFWHAVQAELRSVLRGLLDNFVGKQHKDIAWAKREGRRDKDRVINQAKRRTFRFRREWHGCGRISSKPPKKAGGSPADRTFVI